MTSDHPSTYWDAEVYERIGAPMRRWAQDVIRDLALRGDETVLDAGCGSGSVTFDLLEMLPHGRIYAVDSSAEMIAALTSAIQERGVANACPEPSRRVVPIQADLTDFTLPEPVDCVFSNAVFHWVPDDGLFRCLYGATRPGGRLRAQCGGAGNIARLMAAAEAVRRRRPFARHLDGIRDAKKYRTPQEAIEAMERAGWAGVRATLFEAPITFRQAEEAVLYLRTIILRDHVAGLPRPQQEPYLRAVVAQYLDMYGGPFVADHVRLDLWAVRPPV